MMKKSDLYNQKYKKLQNIGEGSFGRVFSALNYEFQLNQLDTQGENINPNLQQITKQNNKVDEEIKFSEKMQNKQKLVRKNKFVAIKKLKQTLKKGADMNEIREIQMINQLKHENIVNVEEIFIENKQIYIVMDFCPIDLEKMIRKHFNDLTQNDKKFIAQQVDIKPSNLLFDKEGILKFTDFGLTRLVSNQQNQLLTKNVVTRYYRPPEIIFGSQQYDFSVDQWSLGCVLAEIYLGNPLLPGETDIDQLSKIFEFRGNPTEENWPGCTELPYFIGFDEFLPQNIKTKIKDIPEEMADLIENLLQINPKKRMTIQQTVNHPFFKEKLDISKCDYPKKIIQNYQQNLENQASKVSQQI